MKEKFAQYNLELQEVLIGTPTSSPGDKRIEDILTQLRSRQIAEEQVETYARQEKAAVKERELREAEAKARQQQNLTESELAIIVQSNQGKAEAQRALQQREQIATMAIAEASKNKTLAEADAARVCMLADAEASRIRAIGEAEADKTARVGIAQAIAIEEQVKAYGGPRFQLTQQVMSRFAEAIERSGVDVVPKIMFGGAGGGDGAGKGVSGGNNVFEALLALMLSDRFADATGTVSAVSQVNPQAEATRRAIRQSLMKSTSNTAEQPKPTQDTVPARTV